MDGVFRHNTVGAHARFRFRDPVQSMERNTAFRVVGNAVILSVG